VLDPSLPKTAFLGLGLMGGPMASRLLDAGADLAVWNRSIEKCAALSGRGARAGTSPGDAAANAEINCLCLTDAGAVEEVVFGPGGVADAAKPGAVIVDFSSIGVDDTRRLAARAQGEGLAWIDAPVSGGVAAASAGSLVIFAGGAVEALETAAPVLAVLSSRVTHLGGPGAGQAAKLCNQLIVSANLLAIAEAIALGAALGVAVERLPDALAGGFADSRPLQIFGPRMATGTYEPVLGATQMMLKDVRNVLAASHLGGVGLRLASKVGEIYEQAADAGLGAQDLSALIGLYGEVAVRPSDESTLGSDGIA
jgi:3-hydroxyisobutyrate dehydrogenase-like beta-hydroxyacid dehydrogenase